MCVQSEDQLLTFGLFTPWGEWLEDCSAPVFPSTKSEFTRCLVCSRQFFDEPVGKRHMVSDRHLSTVAALMLMRKNHQLCRMHPSYDECNTGPAERPLPLPPSLPHLPPLPDPMARILRRRARARRQLGMDRLPPWFYEARQPPERWVEMTVVDEQGRTFDILKNTATGGFIKYQPGHSGCAYYSCVHVFFCLSISALKRAFIKQNADRFVALFNRVIDLAEQRLLKAFPYTQEHADAAASLNELMERPNIKNLVFLDVGFILCALLRCLSQLFPANHQPFRAADSPSARGVGFPRVRDRRADSVCPTRLELLRLHSMELFLYDPDWLEESRDDRDGSFYFLSFKEFEKILAERERYRESWKERWREQERKENGTEVREREYCDFY